MKWQSITFTPPLKPNMGAKIHGIYIKHDNLDLNMA